MSISKPRRGFRPVLDRLEPLVLLSGARGKGMVDLRSTPLGREFNRTLLDSTATFRRESVSVASLTASPTRRVIRGGAVVTYKVPIVGDVTSTVKFRTSIDRPRARDIRVSVSRFGDFVSASDRQKVSLAIARLIQNNRDAITESMQPTA